MDIGNSTKLRMCIEATDTIFVAQIAERVWTREKAAFLLKGYFEDEFRYYVDYSDADIEALRIVTNTEKALTLSKREEWEPIEWVRFALGRGIEVSSLLLKFFPGERSIFEKVELLEAEVEAQKNELARISDVLDKPTGEVERGSLLTIIAALCNHSKIDIKKHGAAVEISSLTQGIGAYVSDDTVGRALKKIPEALSSKKRK